MEFKAVSDKEVYRFLGLYVRSEGISISKGLQMEIKSFMAPRSAMVPRHWSRPGNAAICLVYSTKQIVKRYVGDTFTVMSRGRRIATRGNNQGPYDEVVVVGAPVRLIVWRTGLSARELGRIRHLADKNGIAIEYR